MIGFIDELRKEEGHTVLIASDNPDFGGAGCCVEVTGDYTDWKPKRYEGENLLHALENAVADKQNHRITTGDTANERG